MALAHRCTPTWRKTSCSSSSTAASPSTREANGTSPTRGRSPTCQRPFLTRSRCLSESAHFINVTASNTTIPQFDRMVAVLGTPTDRLVIPDPMDIDPAQVAEVCHQHGIEIVGPPPAPIN